MAKIVKKHYNVHYTVNGKPYYLELRAQNEKTLKAHLVFYRHKGEGFIEIKSCELVPKLVQPNLFDIVE